MSETDNFRKRLVSYGDAYGTDERAGWRAGLGDLRSRAMRRVFQHSLRRFDNLRVRTVLDVGCGTGHYAVHFANQGARVTALDGSPAALDAARRLAAREAARGSLEFIDSDFLAWNPAGVVPYDLALCMGVIDYTPEPTVWMAKLRRLAHDVVMSFPARTPFGLLVHGIHRCRGIHGIAYSHARVRALAFEHSFSVLELSPIFPGSLWVHLRRTGDGARP